MKTSNLLLGLWVLVVAGLALFVVYFWKTSDNPYGSTSGAPPVQLDPGKKAPDTPRGPGKRAGNTRADPTPKAPPVIAGRVVDGEGRPLAGVSVRLLQQGKAPPPATPSNADEMRRIGQIIYVDEEDWEAVRPLSDWSEAPHTEGVRVSGAELGAMTTGTQGKFSFTLTVGTSGTFRLSAKSDELGSASAANVVPGQDVELVLSTAGLVTGTVTGQVDGAAVAGARVAFDSGEKEYVGTTDAKGEFRIEAMPPGRFTVRAGAKGRTPILDQAVQVVRGEPVKLVLPRGTTLRIKTIVIDGDAARGAEPPVPGADVVAYEESARVYVVGRSNDYGLAEFPALPAGSWIVNGRAANFVSQGDTLVKVDGNQEAIDEELSFEAAVLTPLEVVDESGNPVPGVEFYTCDQMQQYDVVRSEKLAGTTDAQGKWSFPFEFDGPRCMVYGFKKGFGLVQAYPDDYSAGDPVRLVMKKAVRIHGKVVDENGNVVPDAIVRITFEPEDEDKSIQDSATIQIRTDTAGRYDFGFVPAGYEATVEAETEDAWSDDMPSIDPAEGRTDFEVDLRLEASPEPRFVQKGNGPPQGPGELPKPPGPKPK